MSLAEVADAVDGQVEGAGDVVVRSVATDSRLVRPGALFVALRGERDGHDFVGDAFAAGASAALVARDREMGASPLVRVPDPLAALARLAAAVRARLPARVVAITGSSGKTITKELAAAAIGTRRTVVASPASFNNEIGVPLTLLSADRDTEVIVAEVGSRGRGHIATLAPVLAHDVGVVTNVGLAHVGMFGSPEAIVDAKAELVETLPASGVAVLNADDRAVAGMAARTPARVLTFGTSDGAEVRGSEVRLDERARARLVARFGGESAEVALEVPGEHMAANALAAIAAAVAVGVGVADAAAGVGTVRAPSGRMDVRDGAGGWQVIDDSYNANPQSVAAALRTLVAMGRGRRTWAVLGEMAELGEASAREHDRIGRLVVRLGVARLVVVGEAARATFEAARLEGMPPGEIAFARDVDEAAARVLEEVAPEDLVLVKASRVARLDRVADLLVGVP